MKKFSILSFLMFLVGICMCISCGYFISTAVLTSFGFSSRVSTQTQKVYAISMQKSKVRNELSDALLQLQMQNGAGFIFEKNNQFYLLASIYENINDAELVKTNLKSSGVNAEILEFEIKNEGLSGNFSSEEKNILNEAMKANFEAFKGLYDVAISLDTSVFDKANAKLECNKIYSSLITKQTNLNSFFKDENTEINNLKIKLNYSIECLSCLTCEEYENSAQTFSSLIKLTYCKILLNVH